MTKSNDNVGEVKMMMCEKGEWGSYVAPAPHWLMGDSSHPYNKGDGPIRITENCQKLAFFNPHAPSRIFAGFSDRPFPSPLRSFRGLQMLTVVLVIKS
jgi:hypothetical protein